MPLRSRNGIGSRSVGRTRLIGLGFEARPAPGTAAKLRLEPPTTASLRLRFAAAPFRLPRSAGRRHLPRRKLASFVTLLALGDVYGVTPSLQPAPNFRPVL